MFVCILGKCSSKYFTLCVWNNVKQKHKNTHTQIHWNRQKMKTTTASYPTNPLWATPKAIASHPATYREPNPRWNRIKTHPATHRDPLHKTKNQTQNSQNKLTSATTIHCKPKLVQNQDHSPKKKSDTHNKKIHEPQPTGTETNHNY